MRGIDIPDQVKRRLLNSANDRDSDSRGIGEWREGAVVKKSRCANKVNKKLLKSPTKETNRKHD